MGEYTGETRKNTIHPKPVDSMESGEVLRLTYITGTEDPEALPDRHTFQGGLNTFTDEAELRAAKRPIPAPRPPR